MNGDGKSMIDSDTILHAAVRFDIVFIRAVDVIKEKRKVARRRIAKSVAGTASNRPHATTALSTANPWREAPSVTTFISARHYPIDLE